MYIKLKNPQRMEDRALLIATCLVGALILGIIAAGVITAGTPFAFPLALFYALGESSWGGLLVVAVLHIGLISFLILGIYKSFKSYQKWQNDALVYALDFQPANLILLSKQPVALAYKDTHCKLVIEIEMVKSGNSGYAVPAVRAISICLDSKPVLQGEFLAPESPCENFRFMPSYKLDHLASFEDIFPFLDFSSRFHQFSYDLYTPEGNKELQTYRAFVDRQIQNHLLYGVHLSFSKKNVMVRIGLLLFLLLLALPVLLVLLEGTIAQIFIWAGIAFLGLELFVAFQLGFPLFKQHRAYKILKQAGRL